MNHKKLVLLFLVTAITCCGFLFRAPGPPATVNSYFTKQLKGLRHQLLYLKAGCDKKENVQALRNRFYSARLSFKLLAVLSDYFFPNESRLLNGPPLNRVEEDSPDKILFPHGFQVLENYLFGTWENRYYKTTGDEIVYMLTVLKVLENQNHRESLFHASRVWDAIRSASVRLTTLGITGFDSPLAMHSLPEAAATLKGIKELLVIVSAAGNREYDPSWKKLMTTLDRAADYVQEPGDFNNFNRLHFINECIDPFYDQLRQVRILIKIPVPNGRYPVNFDAASIFSEDFFNRDFFTPGNNYKTTSERIRLGKKLFYDPVLSGTGDRSCASCHRPELAFTDGLKTALSIDHQHSLLRNTPTLLNSALQSRQFYDSRTDILENQLDEVLHNPEEMKGSLLKSIAVLKSDKSYDQLFRAAYGQEAEPVSAFNAANAISSYIRSLIVLNSRFDQYMRGDRSTLSGNEKNGFNLFMGKAKCATCHHPPLFNGLLPPDFIHTESEVIGVPATADSAGSRLDGDLGKFLYTYSAADSYSFKTPGLRNVEITSPYMHNGVFKTLQEVIAFYNKGGGMSLNIAPKNQTLPFDRLNLSADEQASIISFLKTLTDTTGTEPGSD